LASPPIRPKGFKPGGRKEIYGDCILYRVGDDRRCAAGWTAGGKDVDEDKESTGADE